LRAKLPDTRIDFDPGTDLDSAAKLARSSDLAIVFAYQWESEGMDLPNLSLPDNQDALIERVAAANSQTVVVLETGSAVTMPWLDKVAGVVEAWYAGSSGHKALANVLVGDVNPSGKLAITFPKSEQDLPHAAIPPPPPHLRGQGSAPVNAGAPPSNYAVHYDEGAEVGYKWFQAEHKTPLFPFGFGLSYTTFAYSALSVDSAAKTAQFTVRNTGTLAGTEIAEVYATLPKGSDETSQHLEGFARLAGFARITLDPGKSQTVTVSIDPRVFETFDETADHWNLATGDYGVLVGPSSDDLPLSGSLQIR
jgi:beta-glucosidase